MATMLVSLARIMAIAGELTGRVFFLMISSNDNSSGILVRLDVLSPSTL